MGGDGSLILKHFLKFKGSVRKNKMRLIDFEAKPEAEDLINPRNFLHFFLFPKVVYRVGWSFGSAL